MLEGITNTEEDIKRCVHGDESDINAYGGQDSDDTVYNEVMHNYMNLVKFEGELYGQERLLIAISNFVQGNYETTPNDEKQKRANRLRRNKEACYYG